MTPLSRTLITLLAIISLTAPAKLHPGRSDGEEDRICRIGIPITASDMIRQRFLIFGDSLTQQSFEEGGWGARLVSRYQRKADVTLRGYSGYNTRWAIQTMDQIFPTAPGSPKYDLATIWFGANDAALLDRCSGRQHVPLAEYKQNLGALVDRLQALGAQVVVITPAPVDEAARSKLNQQEDLPHGMETPERTLQGAQQYADAAKEVASLRGLPSLDLWTDLQKIPDWPSLLSDGLHFTPEGNAAVYDLLMELIDNQLPQFREEGLLEDFPRNIDIGADNYEAVFKLHAAKRLPTT